MTIPQHIFKGYDIRGIYPTELNEENIVPIVRAIYTFLHEEKPHDTPLTVVVGTDMRLSSPSLTKKAIETLVSLGAEVVDIGMVSTPTFYFAVYHYAYDCGVQITASHNPKEWNGIKMVKNSSSGLVKIGKGSGMEEIRDMALMQKSLQEKRGGTVTKKTGIVTKEVQYALKLTGGKSIKKFKIVADAANAMGATYIDALFSKVPATLIRMNFTLDGNFPSHQPDPLQFETLADLQKRVVAEQADLGLAPDGDGDRLFFIDERGKVIPATLITSLVARELLRTHRGATILFDIRNILTPQKIVEEYGGTPHITKVGHAFITQALHKTGAIFAGEGSGHYFFRDTGNAESPMPIILAVLGVMTRESKPLSKIVNELRRSCESREINFRVSNASELMDEMAKRYQDGEISLLDGVTISFPDWRFNLRASNTEPLVRLNLEAYDRTVLAEKKKEVVRVLESLVKQ